MYWRIILFMFFLLLLPEGLFAGNKSSDELIKEIEAKYPKAYIIKKEDFSPNALKYNKNIQTLISGDFDCNNIKDDALQIYDDGVVKLIVIHRFKDGKHKIIEISKSGEWSIDSLKKQYEMVIALKNKGQRIEFYCDCESADKEEQKLCKNYADKKSPKGCSLKLKCDAIEWIYIEKGAELFYFDKKSNKYQSIITAD